MHHRDDGFVICEVGLYGQSASPHGLNLAGGFKNCAWGIAGNLFDRARRESYICPTPGKFEGDPHSEAAAGTCHQRNLACKFHDSSNGT
jgi:hypothetical protein